MTPNTHRTFAAAALALILFAGFAGSAAARTKLVALPERARMVVNLQHPQYSLAIEERTLALNRGLNKIDFAWQGVNIDAASIQIQMLSNPDTTNILNVTYPPNENALVWEIFSPEDREERVRIYYLLHGIARTTQYRMTANEEETVGNFISYYNVSNQSGEDLENAELVTNWPSEFQRTVESGETLKLRALENEELPIHKAFYLEPDRQSPDPEQKYRARMYYEFDNNEEHGLGNVLLPYGKYRIFQRDPQGSTIFLGEDWGKELAVGEEQQLFLGMANDIVVKRVVFDRERKNIRRNGSRKIVAYDETVTMSYEVDNFRDKPTELKIKETIRDYWELEGITGPGSPSAERKSNDELELTLTIPPKTEKQEYKLTYVRLNQLE